MGLLELYVGNLQACRREFGVVGWQIAGCMLATYRSYVAHWDEFGQFGVIDWQPTGPVGLLFRSYGTHWTEFGAEVGNLQVLWGNSEFEAVGWQPTVGNLEVLWGNLHASSGLCVGNLQRSSR